MTTSGPNVGRRPWLWGVAAALAAFIPVAGAFSTTSVFYLRDLTLYFWPRHRWLRQTWFAGDSPWWDPYAGAGQSAVADALNQFFLPVTLLRLMLPDALGFNLWVALPFPVAAVGAWLWLRRHVGPVAAFVGALAFAVTGPMLSTGNFPNLSWSAALIPWAAWAVERVDEGHRGRRMATLAVVVALQALSGEPVTLAATCAVVLAYPLAGVEVREWRARLATTARVAAGLLLGALLAAVQLLPLAVAAARSPRGERITNGFWSLHPLGLLEFVLPHLFGRPMDGPAYTFPWMRALNSGREPLLFSLYLGVGVLVLALIRLDDEDERMRRWRRFWWAIALAALVCAAGSYTPVYRLLQDAFPVLYAFRYPVKYILLVPLALAGFVAAGSHALAAHARGRGTLRTPMAALLLLGALIALSFSVAIGNVLFPERALPWYEAVARIVGAQEPGEAAGWIVGATTPLWVRLGMLSCGAAVLILVTWQRHRAALASAVLLGALALIDPFMMNRDLNPMAPHATFSAPRWLAATRAHAGDRVYLGGQLLFGSLTGPKPTTIDAPEQVMLPAEQAFAEALVTFGTQHTFSPAAWGVRQVISYDLPGLWPREYRIMLRQFVKHPFADRVRFLGRAGVRYCALPQPPYEGAPMVMSLAPLFIGYDLYECHSSPRRTYITGEAQIEPNFERQIDLMFDAAHDPSRIVVLEREPPPPAGGAGTPVPPSAQILSDRNTEVVVRAAIGPAGGYLNLLDSYDPFWRVTVDGEPAPLLRANMMFRAVRLAPGTHEVRFAYRPTPLYAGAALSCLAALILLGGCLVESRRQPALHNECETPGASERAAASEPRERRGAKGSPQASV